jgi:hypothetical protein
MLFELARGARPELFIPQRRTAKKGKERSTIPLRKGTIGALKMFLPRDSKNENQDPAESTNQRDPEDQRKADQTS